MKRQYRFLIYTIVILSVTNLLSFIAGKNYAENNFYDISKSTVETEKKTDKKADKKEKDVEFFDENTGKLMSEILTEIKGNYYKDTPNSVLNEGLLKGMVNSLGDPYSEFLNVEEFKKFRETTDAKYVGVGLVISPGEDGSITVVAPVKGSPAFKAGILTGDKIIKVDGIEYDGSTMQDAVNKMRGKKGEKVKVSVLRNENNEYKELEFELIRETIKLQTVDGKMLDNKVAYIAISEFDKPTYTDFKAKYDELKKMGAEKLVLDLRGNPGGLLDVCVKIADIFLDEGIIVYTKYKNGEKSYYYSDKAKEDLPMVVLVNGGSASASEIVSGALKDRKRAKIVGTQTFGKGIVQRLFDLSYGTAVKLTISEYFTPNGENIHGKGIKPDYVVELPKDTKAIGPENLKDDTQLQKALEILEKEK